MQEDNQFRGEVSPTEPLLSSERNHLRLDDVHAMLSQSYWSPGITKDEIAAGIENSALAVGAYAADGRQIGFLRVISDKVRFAYILDVIVAEDYRGRGTGQAMVRFAMTHPDLQPVYQWMLKTKDAHGVYARCGFVAIEDPERWMGMMQRRPDRKVFPSEAVRD
ncbi:MAG TPA: GNAT family N-acetyltransferase [Anaeromyxobacteraceae bacterium]|nr:GNAT family N-acetyltransferase [Anaeromyxobacteraceae bacterium]